MKKPDIHKQIQKKMLLYLDGDLREADAEHVRSHVMACPMCSQTLENYRRLWRPPSCASEKSIPSQRLWNHILARLDDREGMLPFSLKLRELIRRYAFSLFMVVMIHLAVAAGAVIGSSGRHLSFESSADLSQYGSIAEEFGLGLFDIAPRGSLTEIFDGPGKLDASSE